MIRLTVLYGQPPDPAEFDRYYWQVHMPLAGKMRGWLRWTVEPVLGTPDGSPSPYHMVVGLYARSREEMERILATPEARAASADVANFATGGATFLVTEVHDIELGG
jgi:uncharacterized protein (TIGR02118 family)